MFSACKLTFSWGWWGWNRVMKPVRISVRLVVFSSGSDSRGILYSPFQAMARNAQGQMCPQKPIAQFCLFSSQSFQTWIALSILLCESFLRLQFSLHYLSRIVLRFFNGPGECLHFQRSPIGRHFFFLLPPHVDFKTWSVFRGSQQWFTKGKSGLTNLISPTMRWPAWSITGEQWMFTLTSLSFVIVSHYITKDKMTNYGFNMWTAKWIKNCTTNPRGLWPVTQSQVGGKSLRLCPRTLPSSGLPQCKSDADLLELYLLWPSTGSQRWLLDWSISHIRRYWDSWVCSVRREEGSGILSMSINSQWQRMKTRD